MLLKCGSENVVGLYFGSAKININAGSSTDDFASAFSGNYNTLKSWFQRNTGPKVALTEEMSGNVTITNQAEADGLGGVMVTGRVIVSASDITIRNFGVQWDGSGTGKNLLEATDGVDNVTVTDFLLDGLNGNISYGLTGTTYSENWTVERGEIRGMGGDGIRTFKNSTYRHMYVHSFREWDEDVDGVYDPNGSQSLYPHTDGIQTIRSGNLVEECWIENTDATNSTSGCIVKSDTDEQIDGFTMRKCFVDGGGVPFYIDNANSDIDNPGTHGQPINLVFEDILIGENHREARTWRHSEVPSSNFTKTNILYLATRTEVEDVFVDGFNRSNENLEANTNWQRVSGSAGALTVDTNQVRSTSTTQATYLISTDLPVDETNHFVETNWKSGTTTGWMIARYTDENNYVGMQILSSVPTLYTRIGGTFTSRVASNSSLAAGDSIRIECFGQEIRLIHKGVLRGTYTMGAGVLTSGRVGLQARTTVANPMCDNFVAGTLAA